MRYIGLSVTLFLQGQLYSVPSGPCSSRSLASSDVSPIGGGCDPGTSQSHLPLHLCTRRLPVSCLRTFSMWGGGGPSQPVDAGSVGRCERGPAVCFNPVC